ncbi:hypothetical protein KSF78_0009075 [Schistosoma japonicum]|nr:hypothetical protein KSF78_0009075 [Schistosoma japonicum]
MMLLLLLYINVSLMLIHESTQLKFSEDVINELKRNISNAENSLNKLKSQIEVSEQQLETKTDCERRNIRGLRGQVFIKKLVKHNGLLYCRNLVKGSPSNINGIGTIARELEVDILNFNGYHMMVYVLKEILKEMEYSGTTVK